MGWCFLRLVQTVQSLDGSPEQLNSCLIIAIVIAFLTLHFFLQLNQIRVVEKLPIYFHRYFSLCKGIEEVYMLPKTLKKDIIYDDVAGIYIFCSWWTWMGCAVLTVVISIFKPTMPILLTSIFKFPNVYLKFFYLFANTVFMCYAILSIMSNAFIYAATGMEGIFTCCMLTRELRLGQRKYRTKRKLRTAKHFMIVYRQLQIWI
ncbi:unnamed protein product [Allacma fusca]|uniref:Uncharacterized protein n=1 Tax=Allacma fusca TaxID=39272 RepID=A0A8J2JTI6_9HEXA|nr:unnamed protein product [Allacma fusca]